jgi:hypothetical protein
MNPTRRADVALATLRDLSRAAPDDLATASLSVWAHAAATRGDTPRALAAIHRAQKLTPRHHPTVVLRRLLIDGVDPTTLAAVHLPEAALLATPTGITPAVVSTSGGTDGPTTAPPAGRHPRHRIDHPITPTQRHPGVCHLVPTRHRRRDRDPGLLGCPKTGN